MLAKERMSQILPTVKCSDCGEDVQIRKLGEHVCSNMPPVPDLPILPRQNDKHKPSPSPISPLQSPTKRYDTYSTSQDKYSNSSNQRGPMTPPYQGLVSELRRPSAKDQQQQSSLPSPSSSGSGSRSPTYRDDSRLRNNEDYNYRGHTSPKSTGFPQSAYDRPLNSTSPAPGDLTKKSPRQPHSPPREYFDQNRGYEPAKDHQRGGALDTLMADLMNSFGSDINDSTQRPDDLYNNNNQKQKNAADQCQQCGDEFDYRDDVVNDRNKYYHKQCYTCQLCRTTFDHRRPCFDHNGKLYCERDYNVVKKRITCAGCERPITANTNSIKALGQYYHPGHVKCYHCYQPIDERTGYKEHQGRLYCKTDFKALFLPSCRACGKAVERQAVSATDGKLQGKWHLDCFGCHTCHRPFPDNTFYVFDNSPYCKRHYHQLNNSLCRTCDEPIEGPCAQTIEGWRFHPACFSCNVCRCEITDTYYMFERRIYCETHIRQLQRQRNIRAEKRKTQFGRI